MESRLTAILRQRNSRADMQSSEIEQCVKEFKNILAEVRMEHPELSESIIHLIVVERFKNRKSARRDREHKRSTEHNILKTVFRRLTGICKDATSHATNSQSSHTTNFAPLKSVFIEEATVEAELKLLDNLDDNKVPYIQDSGNQVPFPSVQKSLLNIEKSFGDRAAYPYNTSSFGIIRSRPFDLPFGGTVSCPDESELLDYYERNISSDSEDCLHKEVGEPYYTDRATARIDTMEYATDGSQNLKCDEDKIHPKQNPSFQQGSLNSITQSFSESSCEDVNKADIFEGDFSAWRRWSSEFGRGPGFRDSDTSCLFIDENNFRGDYSAWRSRRSSG